MEAERKEIIDRGSAVGQGAEVGQESMVGQGAEVGQESAVGQGAATLPAAEAERVSAGGPGAGDGGGETLGILKLIASFVVLVLSTILPVAALFGFGGILGAAVEDNLVFTFACAVGAMIGVCVLGGAPMFRLSRGDLAHVWKVGGGILIITIVMTLMQATTFLTGEASLSPTWPTDVLYCLALCLAIGFYEESFVRGILFNGLLAPFGRWRPGLIASAILSSVFFGCMHIDWAALDYGDSLQMSQALLKILQTTIYGVVLCACVAKGDRLTAAALYHAFDDFLLMVVPCGLIGEVIETEYVSTGESGEVSVVLYAILIVLYIPSFLRAMRVLATLPVPRRGGFVRASGPASGGVSADPRPAAAPSEEAGDGSPSAKPRDHPVRPW